MYDYKFYPEAEKELAKLNRSVQILFAKALNKILKSPELDLDLDNKNSLDLSGLKKMYFDNKRYRIVYEIFEEEILIHLVAIGKRDKMDVYKKAGERVEK